MRTSDVLSSFIRRPSLPTLSSRLRITAVAAGVLIFIAEAATPVTAVRAETAASEVPAAVTPVSRTVRVGFYRFPGYHNETAEERSGYGFDFLQLLSRYVNLNYEYVGYNRNWDDMQALLLSGQIDLLTSAAKTPEREALFAFSNPIGTGFTRLTVRADDNRIHIKENDYRPLSGLRIGVINGTNNRDRMAEFAKNHGFSYREVCFVSEADADVALRNGTIDALAASSLRRMTGEKEILRFSPVPFYVMVRKDDTALLNEINAGIEQMNFNEGDWGNKLFYKNFVRQHRELVFSPPEQVFIDNVRAGRETITAGVEVDSDPYAYLEDGHLKGIIPDYFAHLMATAGLPYRAVALHGNEDPQRFKEAGAPDLLMSCAYAYQGNKVHGNAIFTSPYLTLTVARVTRKNFRGPIRRVAALTQAKAERLNDSKEPEVEYVIVPTRTDALKAVERNDADVAYVFSYFAEKYLYQKPGNNLTYTVLQAPVYQAAMCINPASDHRLAGIVNKLIRSESPQALDELFIRYTNYEAPKLSVPEFLKENPWFSISVLLLIASAYLILILRSIVTTNEQRRAKEELAYAETLKKKNEELQRLVEREAAANQAKREFLFNMSHDIRTPMNAILGFAEIAGYHLTDPAKLKDYLAKIHRSGDNLLALINNVLEMSRIETGKAPREDKPCSLTELFQSVLVSFEEATAKKRLTITPIVHLRDNEILADETKLRQILTNVVSNAVKYTPEGGQIQFTVEETDGENPESLYLRITVADNGIGISSEFLPHIFEQFERERNTTSAGIEGTGLGMAIVKNLVELLGGTIAITSERGKGTTVTITTPHQRVKGTETTDAASAAQPALSLVGCRVLLAEDNPLNAEIAQAVLKMSSIDVDVVRDGEECVHTMEMMPPEYYAAILMDIQMPVMDGYEATRLIRAMKDPEKNGIPIIAMTANAFAEDRAKAFGAGMDDFLAKPLDFTKVVSTLKRAILRRPHSRK